MQQEARVPQWEPLEAAAPTERRERARARAENKRSEPTQTPSRRTQTTERRAATIEDGRTENEEQQAGAGETNETTTAGTKTSRETGGLSETRRRPTPRRRSGTRGAVCLGRDRSAAGPSPGACAVPCLLASARYVATLGRGPPHRLLFRPPLHDDARLDPWVARARWRRRARRPRAPAPSRSRHHTPHAIAPRLPAHPPSRRQTPPPSPPPRASPTRASARARLHHERQDVVQERVARLVVGYDRDALPCLLAEVARHLAHVEDRRVIPANRPSARRFKPTRARASARERARRERHGGAIPTTTTNSSRAPPSLRPSGISERAALKIAGTRSTASATRRLDKRRSGDADGRAVAPPC